MKICRFLYRFKVVVIDEIYIYDILKLRKIDGVCL